MERLQAAINKARNNQGETARTTRARPVPAQPRDDTSEAWEALPEAQLAPKLLRRNRIVTSEAGPEATPFDMLRTRTLRHMQEQGWRRLAITSPTPACGKSTVTLNLALSIARQSAAKAIEIEMDMRRPSQNQLLGLRGQRDQNGPGVPELLTGDASFADVGFRYGPGLALATGNAPVANASDILLDDRIGQTLDAIEQAYQPQLMLFDMPPLLVSDDTMAFMRHVDCVLIVAAAERSSVSEIDRCERELASQTNVLGVVLNKSRFSTGEYGGYGDYSYDYDSPKR